MLTAAELLEKEFLDTRCMLIELAAGLDRIDRAATRDGKPLADARLKLIYESLGILADPSSNDRSERLLTVFTDKES